MAIYQGPIKVAGGNTPIVALTKAQYDALSTAQKTNGNIYMTTDEEDISAPYKYYVATAGANGDFYVTIPTGTSLALNDIVNISFPTATNGASNARLSIDGGTTYKNIEYSNIRLASEVASRKLSFVYDGNAFIPLNTAFFPVAYTPTLTTQYGTITSYTATGSYIHIGKLLFLTFEIMLTNVGTAAGLIFMTPPVPIAVNGYGRTKETLISGVSGFCDATASLNRIDISKVDSTTLLVTGSRHSGTLNYKIA